MSMLDAKTPTLSTETTREHTVLKSSELSDHGCAIRNRGAVHTTLPTLQVFTLQDVYTLPRNDYINQSLRIILCSGRDLIS